MAASPAIPGLFFCFAAAVLLLFVSISSPTWEKISFLDVSTGGQTTHFGVFGFTGSSTHIGYLFPSSLGSTNLNTEVMHNLTKVLILHPIAAGLSGLAVLFGICGASYHRAGTIMMSLAALLAFLVTLVVWVIDMVLFGIVRSRVRSAANSDAAAQYGNANWITLGALAALALAFCAGACGSFGRYRRRNNDYKA
ncbi:pali-domain-containing protein [Phellopilus nigrolimitatus]|nr:pali-domain-containing protein [Phellopilus nigrolimitatus]